MPLGPIMTTGVMSGTIFPDSITYKTREEVNKAFARAFSLINSKIASLEREITAVRRGEVGWAAIREIFGDSRGEIIVSEIEVKTGKKDGLETIKSTITAYQTAIARGDQDTIDRCFQQFRNVAITPGPDLIRSNELSIRTKTLLIEVVSIIEGIRRFYQNERAAAIPAAASGGAVAAGAARGAFVVMVAVPPPTPTGAVAGASV